MIRSARCSLFSRGKFDVGSAKFHALREVGFFVLLFTAVEGKFETRII